MNKKHLLLLTPGFAENESDTTCIPAIQLYVRELESRNLFDISIITFHYPYSAKTYNWYNAEVIALGGNNKQGIRRLANLRNAILMVKKIQENKSIDFIQSFWLGECAWVGERIAKQFSILHCCTLMGQDALKVNWRIKRMKKLPTLIALSKFHSQKLLENTRLVADDIIPWGVEENSAAIANTTRIIDVLGVGNLISLKGYERFIEIIFKLKAILPRLKVEIIGIGQQKKALQELIEHFNLTENISLIGKLDRRDVLDKMAQSKCLLHASVYESFGLVIPEALSQGTHVFSTPVGIASEIASVNLFETNEQAVRKLSDFLLHKIVFLPEVPYPISKTVDSYINNVFLN